MIVMSFDEVIHSTIVESANKIADEIKQDRALMNLNELASYLNCGKNSVYEHFIYQDGFPFIMVGSRKMFPRKAVDQWLSENTKTYKGVR